MSQGTTTAPDTSGVDLRRWRAGLVTAFFLTGIGMATWVSRTPAIRDAVDASTAQMGLIIAGLSVGSVLGIAAAGPGVARLGARVVIATGLVAIVAGLLVVSLGVVLGDALVVAAGLALYGSGMGSGEIGLNVHGVQLEIAVGRSVVPGLHGCYSLGIFVGGMVGLAANAAALSPLVHLVAVAGLAAVASWWLVGQLPGSAVTATRRPGVDDPAAPQQPGRVRRLAWLDRRLLALGVIILGMALAEGSANDWLPLIVVDGYGESAALGSVVYASFGLAMAVGRLTGGRVIDRFGRAPVMRVSAVTAAVGIAVVAFAPNLVLGAVGVLLWGLGTSLGFPVALSAAGDDTGLAAERATFVASAGYAAFLAGPPVLGLIGEEVGLRSAILVVLVAVLVTTFFARAVGGDRPAARR